MAVVLHRRAAAGGVHDHRACLKGLDGGLRDISRVQGEEPEATTLAKATIEALEGYDTVIVNAAGCGSAMKDYGHVLRDDPAWAERKHVAVVLIAEPQPAAFTIACPSLREGLSGSSACTPARTPRPRRSRRPPSRPLRDTTR